MLPWTNACLSTYAHVHASLVLLYTWMASWLGFALKTPRQGSAELPVPCKDLPLENATLTWFPSLTRNHLYPKSKYLSSVGLATYICVMILMVFSLSGCLESRQEWDNLKLFMWSMCVCVQLPMWLNRIKRQGWEHDCALSLNPSELTVVCLLESVQWRFCFIELRLQL